MEDQSEAFGLNQRASVLDSETVSETDVLHGKHQTDPIQGMSSKAAESGQGSSDLRNLGEKKNEKTDKVDRPAGNDEGPGIELNRPETETPVGGQRIPHIIQVHQDGSTALGHNAERLSATRGVAASVPSGLSTGGFQSNINPFGGVSCTQRQSSRQSSTTAPSPQYTLPIWGWADRRTVAARADAATAGGRQDVSIAGCSSIRRSADSALDSEMH